VFLGFLLGDRVNYEAWGAFAADSSSLALHLLPVCNASAGQLAGIKIGRAHLIMAVPFAFVSAAICNSSFAMLFVPAPDANGVTRFLIEVLDDYNAPSNPVVVELTVLPINDPPKFDRLDFHLSTSFNVSGGSFVIEGQVSDIDFKFGHEVALTITVLTSSNASADAGNFSLPAGTPCNISTDAKTVECQAMITDINFWFAAGLDFLPGAGLDNVTILLSLDDLGNIDKWNRPDTTNATIVLNHTLPEALQTKTIAAVNNTLLIVAPIAGLLAAIGIVALLFFFRGRKAASAVDDYFDRMALEMDGSVNASPLYEAAAKGGESVLYKSKA